MLVMNWMSPGLFSVDPEASLTQAARLMGESSISHLPVMGNGTIKGIVSDQDLKKASAPGANSFEVPELTYLLSRVKIKDIMASHFRTCNPFDTIEEALQLMLEHKASALPVVDDDGQVLGMISQNDIFRALITLTGVVHGGVQFALDLPDKDGSLKRATDILRKYGKRMVSTLTSYDRVEPGRKWVYIRMKSVDRHRLLDLKNELSQVGVLLYVLDSRNKTIEHMASSRLSKEPQIEQSGSIHFAGSC